MESCKYHPVTPSMFHCGHCQDEFCDTCVDHSVGGEARCFVCGNHVSYHVTSDNVDPFWRRLEKAFRYPLNANAMMMVIGLSVLSAIIAASPFPWVIALILNLIVVGATINYAFLCLRTTSEGNLEAPPLTEAFAGSIGIIFKLLIMILLLGFGLNAIASYVGPVLAILSVIILFLGMPAILMVFASTDSVLEAANPVNFIRVMTAVGMPYIVLVLFLFIMISSVGLLNSIIGNEFPALSAILQTSVGNYYAVVSFHLMGYMLYQYQDKLGFSTADDEEAMSMAEPSDVILSHVNIRLKEGEYDRAVELLIGGVETLRKERRLWSRLFELLYRTENRKEMQTFADKYLHHLIETAQSDRLASDFKKIRQLLPKYLPGHAHLRFHVANACRTAGDALSAVQLVNGMHKIFPDYEKLVASYQLMKLALDDLPNMEAQALKCASMVKQLQAKYPDQSTEVETPKTHASFTAVETDVEKVSEPEVTEPEPTPVEPAKDYSPIEFKQ